MAVGFTRDTCDKHLEVTNSVPKLPPTALYKRVRNQLRLQSHTDSFSDADTDDSAITDIDYSDIPPSTKSLATVLHRLQMATWPVCYQMALAMTEAGYVELSCFRGLSQEDVQAKMQSCFPFSCLHVGHVRRHLQTLFPQDHNSGNGDVAPLRTHAPDMAVPNSRPVRACTLKRNLHRSSSGSEEIAADGGVHSPVALNQVPRAREPSAEIAADSGVHSLVALNQVPRAREPSAEIAADVGVHSLVALINQVPRAREPRLRKTARMQSHSADTDSEDDAALRRKQSKERVTQKVKSSCISSKSDDACLILDFSEGTSFSACNAGAAKDILLANFKRVHMNGHCVTNNSR